MRFAVLVILFATVSFGCGSKPPPPPAPPAPAPAPPPPPPPAPTPDGAKDIDPSINPDAGSEAEDVGKPKDATKPEEPAAMLWVLPIHRRG